MFGNCATGRLAMVTAPIITIRMAITIATMGRLMKKLDMDIDSFRTNFEISALASSARAARWRSPGYCGPRRRQASLLFRHPCSCSWGDKCLGLYGRAWTESLLALRHHTFTKLQAVLDNPHGANAFANFYG